jgi:hypothetical protein
MKQSALASLPGSSASSNSFPNPNPVVVDAAGNIIGLVQDGPQNYGAVIPDTPGTFLLAGVGALNLPGAPTVVSVGPGVWTAFVAKLAPWDAGP